MSWEVHSRGGIDWNQCGQVAIICVWTPGWRANKLKAMKIKESFICQ